MGFLGRLLRRTPERPVDPNTPHVFKSLNDPGMGAAFARSAGGRGGQPLGMQAAATGNFVRELRCGVPGCGRDRDDAIHFPEG